MQGIRRRLRRHSDPDRAVVEPFPAYRSLDEATAIVTRRRRTKPPVLVVLVLVVAACSGSAADDNTTTTVAPTMTAAPTTTVAPTTTLAATTTVAPATTMVSITTFVPPDFDVPTELVGDGFRLEPLGPQHNERDHEAWMSSVEHIRTTPGFPWAHWPTPMALEDNLRDLVRHADDFAARTGFTYTVLDGDEVIGSVYIYPGTNTEAVVRSWVSADRAELDRPLWQAVTEWLDEVWPFDTITYATRS